MEIQYVIINFLILALIIFLFARKLVVSIFRKRRERLDRELEEIEAAEKLEAPTPKEFIPNEDELAGLSAYSQLDKAKNALNDKLSQINGYKNREIHQLHESMIETSRREMLSVMKKYVCEIASREPFASKLKALDETIVDEILSQIKITNGDTCYIKHHDVLYVTLTSTHELPERLLHRIEKATTELVESAGGHISLWVLTDPSLIGGLKLRIGDTLYDGTILEELYHFEKNINRDRILNDDSADDVMAEFFEKATALSPHVHTYQLGRVLSVSDGICWMDGLADIMYGEVIEFECGERGMVLDIQSNKIGCVIFGSYENIESGSKVRRVGRIAQVPVGNAMLGRVVNALGQAIDGEGFIKTTERRPIEFKAPSILDRAPVDTPLHTGIKAIDALVPIGKGQRELIIGDRQTGKSAIAIDTIINQKGKGTICIYVAIGQKETTISEIREKLKAHGALDYTIIVAAPASGSAALQYIAPFSGAAMGEYFMYNGKDVLIVYDDLSKHAVAYRELSLLLHRPSGREAYPGDIFYLHSRLLERAARLSSEHGGGSMTALPIIETLGGDISAYIPTNVISITDGQIFLETDLFNEGQRPAINVSLSVSRVGGAAQTPVTKQVSGNLRARLAQYRELEEFTQFGADVDETTKKTLESGKRLMRALRQSRFSPVSTYRQALLLFAITEGCADSINPEDIHHFEKRLYAHFDSEHKELVEKLKSGKKMDRATKLELKAAIDDFVKRG